MNMQGNTELSTSYNIYLKEHKKTIRQSKMNYLSINNSTNKIRETWNIINNELGRTKKKNTQIVLNYNSETHLDENVSENFGNHFTTSADNIVNNHFGGNISLLYTTATGDIPDNIHSIFYYALEHWLRNFLIYPWI